MEGYLQVRFPGQVMWRKTFVFVSREKLIFYSTHEKKRLLGYVVLKYYHFEVEVGGGGGRRCAGQVDSLAGFRLVFRDLARVVEFRAMKQFEQDVWLRGLVAVKDRFEKGLKLAFVPEQVARYFNVCFR